MSFQVTRRLLVPLTGTLLGCMVLFFVSGLPPTPVLACCGKGMGFPFFCFFLLLTLFSIGFCLPFLLPRRSNLFSGRAAAYRRLQRITALLLSTEIRIGFVLSLFLFLVLILMGTALLFSLSLGFDWSALVLGCLSLLLGLAILLLGLRQTRDPFPNEWEA